MSANRQPGNGDYTSGHAGIKALRAQPDSLVAYADQGENVVPVSLLWPRSPIFHNPQSAFWISKGRALG